MHFSILMAFTEIQHCGSQSEAITDFSRFLHTYDKVNHSHQFECAAEMKALLEKLIETCIYICQPDLSFPPFGANVAGNNLGCR